MTVPYKRGRRSIVDLVGTVYTGPFFDVCSIMTGIEHMLMWGERVHDDEAEVLCLRESGVQLYPDVKKRVLYLEITIYESNQ